MKGLLFVSIECRPDFCAEFITERGGFEYLRLVAESFDPAFEFNNTRKSKRGDQGRVAVIQFKKCVLGRLP